MRDPQRRTINQFSTRLACSGKLPSMSSRQKLLAFCIRRLFLVLCTVAFVALALPAPEARADNLREVAERVARQHDAKKVISARVVERGGRKFYVIRILTRDDVIKTIRVPADGRRYLFNSAGALSDRDRPPGSVVNRRSLPQLASANRT